MAQMLQLNQTNDDLLFFMADLLDHRSGKTGLTCTVTLRKNGGSYASPGGAVSEVANGWYKVAGNATDANTLGPLLLHATATGADPCDRDFQVVADGLTIQSGTATAGAASTITIATAGASGVSNYYAGHKITIISGTGVGQTRTIILYNNANKITTVDRAWLTTPDSTSVYVIRADDAAGLDTALRVTSASVVGNVGGSTASVTADVGITQAAADKVWGTTTRALTDKIGFALSAVGIQAVWDALTSNLTTSGSIGKRIMDFVTTLVYGVAPTVSAIRTEMDSNSTKLANLDTNIASRNAVAPDNASIAAILARTDVATSTRGTGDATAANQSTINANVLTRATPADVLAQVGSALSTQHVTAARLDHLDADISSRNAVAPDNAGVAAIKAKTDALPTDPASNTEVNTRLATGGYIAPPSAADVNTALTTAHGAGTWQQGSTTTPATPADAAVIEAAVAAVLAAVVALGTPGSASQATALAAAVAALIAPATPGAVAAVQSAVNALGTPSSSAQAVALLAAITALPTPASASDVTTAENTILDALTDAGVDPSAIAVAVWLAASRTLTALGFNPGAIIELVSPITEEGDITIHIGDSYGPTPTNQQRITITLPTGHFPDFTDGTGVVASSAFPNGSLPVTIIAAGIDVDQVFALDLLAVQTALLTPRTYTQAWELTTADGKRTTVQHGWLYIKLPGDRT